MLRNSIRAALIAGSLVAFGAVAAIAGNTTLWSSTLGDLNFPFTPPSNAGATPGSIDNMVIGATTPKDGFFINVRPQQSAAIAHNTAATLAPTDIGNGIITSAPAAAIALTLPLATAMDTQFPLAVAGTSFDFSVINTTTTAADTDTMTTNTGWTLVGGMIVTPTTASGVSGRFRATKNGAGAWTLYRLS